MSKSVYRPTLVPPLSPWGGGRSCLQAPPMRGPVEFAACCFWGA